MSPVGVLVGGVGYRWQRDASFGLVASDLLAAQDRPPGVDVTDLGYGAIWVAEDLLHADPPYRRLILLGSAPRGRAPGGLHLSRWEGAGATPEEVQERIREAGAGVIDLEHLLVVADFLGALPEDVVVIELEPVDVSSGEELSPEARARLPEAIALALHEAGAPLAPAPRTPARR